MAIAVATQSATSWTGASSVTVAAPASIAVGDVLIASIGYHSQSAITAPSGWTLIRQDTDGFSDGIASYYKVAVLADVSAVSYAWSQGATGSPNMAGVILRVTGANTNSPITASNGTSQIGNPPITASIGITPNANGLLVAATCTTFNAGISGYAIATSSPSWTTAIDSDNGTNHIGVAYGVRAAATATGSLSFSAATSFGTPFHTEVHLFSVDTKVNVSLSETVTSADGTTALIRIFLAEVVTAADVLVATFITLWTRATRAISSWTNDTRH